MITKIKFVVAAVYGDDLRNLVIIVIIPLRVAMSPASQEPKTDEERVVKKIVDAAEKFGKLGSQVMTVSKEPYYPNDGFIKEYQYGTGLFVTPSEFENMGKPNVGDILEFAIRKIKKDSIKIDEPARLQKYMGRSPGAS